MPTDDSAPEGQPQKPLVKNGRPLTIWDMHVGKSEQTIRESVLLVGSSWLFGGIACCIYWYVMAVRERGGITQRDIDELPLLIGVVLTSGVIVVYLYWRNVFPAARRELEKLQENVSSPNRHSSTTTPPC